MKKISKKGIDAALYSQAEKNKLSKDIASMNHEQIMNYFKILRSEDRISKKIKKK